MPINYESKQEETSYSPTFRDLRHLADDKTVLENPNKGWYYHLVDNSMKIPKYRDRLGDARRLDVPIDHMYIRFDWGDVERDGEGLTDWTEIDRLMDEWGAYGYKFSLRICTYEPPVVKNVTPEWVFEAGAKRTAIEFEGRSGYEPDYGDPVFLEKLDGFLSRCAEKFDNDDRVKYIDIGTFGTWGEGHTYAGSNKLFPAEVLMKHIDLHLKNFKNKLLVLNDDFIEIALRTSLEAGSKMYDYCLGKGLGLRDDSICVDGYVRMFGYNSLRRPSIYKNFAKNAPVDIELAHIHENSAEQFRGGLTVIEALHTAHATYAGFHGYLDEWMKMAPYLHDYLANRLGYWFFIDGVDIGSPSSGAKEICKVLIRNNGYSKCYDQYDLKLRARAADGKTYELNDRSPDSTRWERESVSEETLRLDFGCVPAGEYTLEVAMLYNGEPIGLGIQAERRRADGYYSLFDFTVNAI